METKASRLASLHDELLSLTHSPLYAYRCEHEYLPVLGEGSPDARLMLIGTAPTRQDAQQGRPLVGPSGRILDSLLESIGLRRRDVYVTHIVKDYSPAGNPTPEVITVYAPFLEQQINIIQPRMLATLGRFASEFLLKHFGQAVSDQAVHVDAAHGLMQVLPLVHPAVALYNRSEIDNLLIQFRQIATLLT